MSDMTLVPTGGFGGEAGATYRCESNCRFRS